MKYLIIIAFIFLLNAKTFAQNATTEYDTCQYLQQYAGEWKYINGTDTIKLYLRVNRYYSAQYNTVFDDLWGWHEYKHGNTIVETDYPYRFFTLPYYIDNVAAPTWSIWLFLQNCSTATNHLIGKVTDYLQDKNRHDVYITVNAANTQMTWHQQVSEGHLNDPYHGMTLPANFVLIKQ